MKNEKLILEALQSLVLHSAKTDERLASFTQLLSAKLVGLSTAEKKQLLERTARLLSDAKTQQALVVKIEAAIVASR